MSDLSVLRLFSNRALKAAQHEASTVSSGQMLVSDNLAMDFDAAPLPPALNWGEPLQPHHFDFSHASVVCLKGAPSVRCLALYVPGAGSFRISDSAPVKGFTDGAMIVKAGNQFKLVSFQELKDRFNLANGKTVDNPYQINFLTPKK